MSASGVPEAAGVAVVGGGIIGLAVAHALAARGLEVVVLERGTGQGSAAHASAGMLAPAAEADVEIPGMGDFRRFSHALWPDWVAGIERDAGLDCGFQRGGTLFAALDADEVAEIERLHAIVTDQGFRARLLDGESVLEREPHLSPRCMAGLWLEEDCHVDPRRLLRALELAIAARGGRVLHAIEVESVDEGGGVRGRGQAGDVALRAGCVVVAAGSWSNAGLASPCAGLPLRPVKGQLVRLHGPRLLHGVVRTPDVYVVPHADGDLLVGATVEEQGFDAEPTAGGVLDLVRYAWRALPGLYDLHLREVCVGFRPALRDHRPALGRMPGTRVVAATGHFRNGILLAPGTAQLLADLVCGAGEHALLAHFAPGRFRAPRAATTGERHA